MTTPAPSPASPVPTSQRPINGAISGLFAQLVGNAGTAYLMAQGLDPASATMLATAAGSAVSGTMATVGDAARSQIVERPPKLFITKLLLGLAARIG